MQKLHFTQHINAPREKVWDIMLSDTTYREWTKPFNAGSFYEGSWDEGSDIKFLGVNDVMAAQKARQFMIHDEDTLVRSFEFFEREPELIDFSRQARGELERILRDDKLEEQS